MNKTQEKFTLNFPFTSEFVKLEELTIDPDRLKSHFFELYSISDHFGVGGIYSAIGDLASTPEICGAIWLCGLMAGTKYEGPSSPFEAWKYLSEKFSIGDGEVK